MLDSLRDGWRQLKQGHPGHRFREFHDRRRASRKDQSGWRRALPLVLGFLLTLGGLAIGWLPGPGGFIAIFGVALLATEFAFLARWLDWAELRLRDVWRLGWKQRSTPQRAMVVATLAVVAAGVAWAAGTLLLG